MRTLTIQSILLIVSVFALTACGKAVNPSITTSYGGLEQNPNSTAVVTPSASIKSGNWSSDGVELSVTDSGASLQLPCGSGSLNGPLSLDANHSFQVSGTYSPGVMSEIVSPDGTVTTTQNQPVVYSGTFDSDSQVLTVVMAASDTGQVMNTYSLSYGDPSTPIITCY